MSQYEFDGNNDGEWEDNGDIAWNEADWQSFAQVRQGNFPVHRRIQQVKGSPRPVGCHRQYNGLAKRGLGVHRRH